MRTRGIFITFEGIEGCGKTTQIKLLDKFLKRRGFKTVLTREPGGTKLSNKIRKILLTKGAEKPGDLTELFLFFADRAQHITNVIKPALAAKKIVLCDRFSDSTFAYQGYANNVDLKLIKNLNNIATDRIKPDLTFVLDIDPKAGLARAKKRSKLDRFEAKKIDYHKKVRKGFVQLAKNEKKRIKLIDGSKSINQIHAHILKNTKRYTLNAIR